MTTLTLMLAIALTVGAIMYLLDSWARRGRRREREMLRRLHIYMAQLPPARPW